MNTEISTKRVGAAYFLVFPMAYLVISLFAVNLVGAFGWDDGAITLSYAKTLAEHGRFAINGVSDVAEGTSSMLYTFLVAAFHKVIVFDFYGIIFFSQILAIVFSVALIFVIAEAIKGIAPSKNKRFFLATLFVSLPYFFAEQFNGMEMTLFSLLMVLFCLAVEQRKAGLSCALILLALATRYEAIFYIEFALMAAFVIGRDRFYLGLMAWTAVIFLGGEMLRYAVFDDWMPNTIWAKTHPPYTPENFWPKLGKKFSGLGSFLSSTWVFILAIIYILRRSQKKINFYFLMTIGFAIFALISGKSWGYQGRMFLACFPLLFVGVVRWLQSEETVPVKIHVASAGIRFARDLSPYHFMLLMVLVMHCSKVGAHYENFKTALVGGFHQSLLPGSRLNDLARNISLSDAEFKGWHGVTPGNYKVTGEVVEKLRSRLKLETINFMTPDVGGLALCCGRIRILDSALLTNRHLSHPGYEKFYDYLESNNPEVIETHGVWSKVSGIYNSAFFTSNYFPAIVNGNVFYLRSDLKAVLRLSESDKAEIATAADFRYGGSEIDMDGLRANWTGIYKVDLD